MRALALLCLLHVGYTQYSWHGPNGDPPFFPDPPQRDTCQEAQTSCGCCLMREQMYRMEDFFNETYEYLSQKLQSTKQKLDHMRGGHSAFSVALHPAKSSTCYGPFDDNRNIVYKHAHINLDDSYDDQTGIFTAPHSGVYSLFVTIYGSGSSCASLYVNGELVSKLLENTGKDPEDSATIVVARHLEANDQVAVILPKNCVLCDRNSNHNTFTGFLLYETTKLEK